MNKNPLRKHIVIDARIRRSSTGRYVDRLIEHLQPLDSAHEYSILVHQDDDWQPSAKNFTRVDSPFAQFSLNPLDQIKFSAQLYKLKADIVHFPLNQQPILYFKPVVTSTLDLTMLRFTRAGKTPVPIFKLKMLAYRFLFWYSNKKSRAVITISKFVKKDLEDHYPFTKGKITVTYCAGDPPLGVQAEAPHFLGPKTPFLLFVGTAFPHKNLERLVQAFGELHKDHPELRLVLVGKKEQYYEQLEAYVKQRPDKDGVFITGFLPDSQLKWLYEHCQAYVFPSLSEGFGLPGLEAMVYGAPVISSDASCLPEVYGKAAAYFDPLDPLDMAAVIEKVLDNPRIRQLLINAGHKQAKRYSWDRMAQETLIVYKKVLGE